MNPHELPTFRDVFSLPWADNGPSDFTELLCSDPSSLDEAGRKLRRMLVSYLKSATGPQVKNELDLLDLIRNTKIQLTKDAWNAYAFQHDRRHVKVASERYGLVNLRHMGRKLPAPSELPGLDEGAGWMVIWHGDVSTLTRPGVTHRLRTLYADAPIRDVMVYTPGTGGPPTLYSVKGGRGRKGNEILEFPDPGVLRDITRTKEAWA
jgi:hypothetical protein